MAYPFSVAKHTTPDIHIQHVVCIEMSQRAFARGKIGEVVVMGLISAAQT